MLVFDTLRRSKDILVFWINPEECPSGKRKTQKSWCAAAYPCRRSSHSLPGENQSEQILDLLGKIGGRGDLDQKSSPWSNNSPGFVAPRGRADKN